MHLINIVFAVLHMGSKNYLLGIRTSQKHHPNILPECCLNITVNKNNIYIYIYADLRFQKDFVFPLNKKGIQALFCFVYYIIIYYITLSKFGGKGS